MRKILEYHVVSAHMRQFEDRVNFEISNDWQPFGNPFIDSSDGFYCQAMVKYEEEK